jgi:hypothetical protein
MSDLHRLALRYRDIKPGNILVHENIILLDRFRDLFRQQIFNKTWLHLCCSNTNVRTSRGDHLQKNWQSWRNVLPLARLFRTGVEYLYESFPQCVQIQG